MCVAKLIVTAVSKHVSSWVGQILVPVLQAQSFLFFFFKPTSLSLEPLQFLNLEDSTWISDSVR